MEEPDLQPVDLEADFKSLADINSEEALEWAKADVELTRESLKPYWPDL